MTMMRRVQAPAVAGLFYTADPQQLSADVRGFVAEGVARAGDKRLQRAKAIIVPHAGYVYSGAIAGSAYAAIAEQAAQIKRVLILGPPHRIPVRGIAISGASAFETPLGQVPIDEEVVERLIADYPQVSRHDQAFNGEHCIEVQLPFLQVLLEHFSIVPMLVGEIDAQQVAEILEPFWAQDESLILISSDLSHYLDDATGQALDARTSESILNLQPERIGSEQACGRHAIAGLLQLAKRHQGKARLLDLRNSGDTAGPRDRVVGYGAYAFG
ncbi:MAG: AmmeMemoRadiSam system protein B [Lamprobacter sp.]|uniref:AmmeMemoRadiSam system protein B n=1 Tax=Lamprobacter sp. TaxID=3100796 RepID=UPI002B2587F6|nr:AmmeMemoRadiSam system protein B [Lamprobacter sp.]MEA3639528.1 AmmeMemoRadiSam system protein B [Lamprobacter sp.]